MKRRLPCCDGCIAKNADGDIADEIMRTSPTSEGKRAGKWTGGAAQIGSPVKLRKPATS